MNLLFAGLVSRRLPAFRSFLFALIGCQVAAAGHEVLVCSYFTAEGSRLVSPTREHPAFYSLTSTPARETVETLDDVEGLGPEGMHRLLRRALAGNGFLPEAETRPAELIVVCHWGVARPQLQDE